MKKVTLKFKKRDFEGRYENAKTCAITTALKRAGHSNLEDCGLEITHLNYEIGSVSEPKTYDKMFNRVGSMYLYRYPTLNFSGNLKPTKPKDFQITILLDV
tara:strand:+ start:41136 stop:41438 length:303 start_codon:yes stop_codon:yes gene_type:complete